MGDDPAAYAGSIDQMLPEIGTLALSVVTLLLQRLDKRREDVRRSSDLQTALLALSESLGRWAEAAKETNRELSRIAQVAQGKQAESVRSWLYEEGTGDAPSPQAVLATYAPELRDELGRVAATRAEQLEEMKNEVSQAVLLGSPPQETQEKLAASAAALEQAKRELDKFIRMTFPRPPD